MAVGLQRMQSLSIQGWAAEGPGSQRACWPASSSPKQRPPQRCSGLGPLQGLQVAALVTPAQPLPLEHVHAAELQGTEQTMGLADRVVLHQQPPAAGVEQQLQRPDGLGPGPPPKPAWSPAMGLAVWEERRGERSSRWRPAMAVSISSSWPAAWLLVLEVAWGRGAWM